MTRRRAWSHARPAQTALAALAVVGVTLPLHTLFTPTDWFRATTAIVLLIAVVGLLGRVFVRWPAVIAAAQVAIALWATANLCLRETLWWSLPTVETLRAVGADLVSAQHLIAQSAAPVKVTPPLVLSMVLIVSVLAVTVDLVAATLRAPAASGLPLLAAYVASAANSGTGLSAWLFLPPALAWVGMIGHDGLDRMRRWGGTIARPQGGVARDPTTQLLGLARVLGLVGIIGALALPTVLPHFPPTFLADGLGRADGARGGGGGSLTSTLEVSRNLQERSDAVVLTYTTDVPSPPPVRVDVLTRYQDGDWLASNSELFDTGGTLPTTDQVLASGASTGQPRVRGVTTVEKNDLHRPQLAIPGVATALDLAPEVWRVDGNALPRLLDPVDRYKVTWEEIAPPAGSFGRGSQDVGPIDALAIDPAAEPKIDQVLAEIAPRGLTPGETALRIQSYLRSGQFGYTETLAPVRDIDPDGQPLSPDPVTQFLVSKQGYCVQFATAMALMARHRGIPARVAIGFLPGSLNRTTWTVRAKDAHAWPELWFADTGWLRFEPTPGVRAGAAPSWSLTPVASPSASPSASGPSARASDRPEVDVADQTPAATTDPVSATLGWLRDHVVLIATLGSAVLALLAFPVAASIARRRALRRSRDDAERVEVVWESMLSRLGDVGFHPEAGDTPRQAGQRLAKAAFLDEPSREALGRVVTLLERARYAAQPVADVDAAAQAADAVVTDAQGRRRLVERIRARLLPAEGRRAWADLGRFIAQGPRRLRPRRRRQGSGTAGSPD